MARKSYPLEIILRHTGTAELVDSHDETLWSSDSDPDFKDVVSAEFLTEDDIDDILVYLEDNEVLTDSEAAQFESGDWDVTEESLTDEPGVETDDDETEFDEEED